MKYIEVIPHPEPWGVLGLWVGPQNAHTYFDRSWRRPKNRVEFELVPAGARRFRLVAFHTQ